MLGTDLCAALVEREIPFEAPTSSECDITDASSVASFFDGRAFDFVVNCAAYTAVDLAEAEKEAAYLANAIGVGYLAQICSINNSKLIHISTDFVFDGQQAQPYSEDAKPHPVSVYGASKHEGERSVLATGGVVVRTSWLYGVNGKSFPKTIIGAWKAGKPLRVVGDQIGCPTCTVDLAHTLAEMMLTAWGETGCIVEPRKFLNGIYHACGPEAMSWHEFACRAIAAAIGEDVHDRVEAIKSDEWPTPARRPANSVLADTRLASLGIGPMRPVNESLREFVNALSA
jgi:dTDP-4-dehydrorhamnose reductase